MTPAQKELARHALGLTSGRKQSYRNHFVAGPGHDDFEEWERMVAQGEAFKRKWSALADGDFIFILSREGANAALNDGERLDPEDFTMAARPREQAADVA